MPLRHKKSKDMAVVQESEVLQNDVDLFSFFFMILVNHRFAILGIDLSWACAGWGTPACPGEQNKRFYFGSKFPVLFCFLV